MYRCRYRDLPQPGVDVGVQTLVPLPTQGFDADTDEDAQYISNTDQHQFGADFGAKNLLPLSTQGFDAGTNTDRSELSQGGGDSVRRGRRQISPNQQGGSVERIWHT